MAAPVKGRRGGDRLPQRITAVRRKLGLSQGKFAERVGVSSRNVVNDWEAGRTRPRVQALARIAQVGGVTADWLLHGDGVPAPRGQDEAAWQEAQEALRAIWPDVGKRRLMLEVLRRVR